MDGWMDGWMDGGREGGMDKHYIKLHKIHYTYIGRKRGVNPEGRGPDNLSFGLEGHDLRLEGSGQEVYWKFSAGDVDGDDFCRE